MATGVHSVCSVRCFSPFWRKNIQMNPKYNSVFYKDNKSSSISKKRREEACGGRRVMALPMMVVDPWAPSVDSQSIASQLFAASLLPYLGFLYFITKSKTCPNLTLFGFYFLLAFVAATIPAGIYAKVQYGTSLSNVDWLHGGAESLLTLTNLFIVIGLRQAIRNADANANASSPTKVNNKK